MNLDDLKLAAKAMGKAKEADVFAFNSDIDFPQVEKCIRQIRKMPKRQKRAILVLTTPGGSADDGYRLARAFKQHYDEFTVLVLGLCKSAGTLVCLGASEISMGHLGELGPLDVQIGKQDELTLTSGMVYNEALQTLKNQSFQAWEDNFLSIKNKSGGNISTKTAADIATQLTVGLFAEIARQIDPFRLGEHSRACNIAAEYGCRLHKNDETVMKLVMEYSHHGFVIDRDEASEFIETVREIDESEKAFEDAVGGCFRMPLDKSIVVGLLYSLKNEQEPKETETVQPTEQSEQKNGDTNGQEAGHSAVPAVELESRKNKLSAPRKLKRISR